ncbi:Gamma-tubulin complex component 3, partial [Trichinella zimbabwensis]
LRMSFLKRKMIDLASALRNLAKAILKDDDLAEEYEEKIDQAVCTLNSGFKEQESVNDDEQVNEDNQVNADKQANEQIRSIQKSLLARNEVEPAIEVTSLCYDLKDMGVGKIAEILRFLVAVTEGSKEESTAILDSEIQENTAECLDNAEMASVGQYGNAWNSVMDVESSESLILTGEEENDTKSSTCNSVVVPRNAYDPEKFMCETDTVMHECLFVLQGISGKLIRIDHTTETIKFVIPVKKPFGEQLKQLSVYGFLYMKLRRFCNTISNSYEKKVLLAAFSCTVDDFLRRYYAAIAELEAELFSRIRKRQENPEQNSKYIGLPPEEVFVKLWNFKAPMLSLSEIVDKSTKLSSGKFMSNLYAEAICGHSKVEKVATDALGKVCLKLKQMILSWMYEGVIKDDCEEFFIYKTKTDDSDDSWWSDSYKIRDSSVPCFLSPHIVRKILITGKSVLFLQKACGKPVYLSPFYAQRDLLRDVDPTYMFTIEEHHKISSLITASYKTVSRTLLDVLSSKLNIKFHLKALKNYVLLYRGDFATHLLEALREEWNALNLVLCMHLMAFTLESAIRNCCSKKEIESGILNQIDLKFLQPLESVSSLDTLIITYRMTPEVSTIFNETTKPIYAKLFSFLWRLRRISFMLYSNGTNFVSFSKDLKTVPEFNDLWQKFALMNNELMNFVKNVEYYCYSQVLENEWLKFMSAFQDAVDFDDVINAHNEFLKQLLDKMFLSEKHAKVMVRLRMLFGMVLDFQKLYDEFISTMDEEIVERTQLALEREELGENGQWSTADGNEFETRGKKEKLLVNLKSQFLTSLMLFKDAYRTSVGHLLVVLAEENDRMLSQFSFQIDYSRWFYRENENVRNSIRFRNINQ